MSSLVVRISPISKEPSVVHQRLKARGAESHIVDVFDFPRRTPFIWRAGGTGTSSIMRADARIDLASIDSVYILQSLDLAAPDRYENAFVRQEVKSALGTVLRSIP